jgi:hypothetical protein
MNVEIGTETPIFLFWEYLFRNFGILSLQCINTFLTNGKSVKCILYIAGKRASTGQKAHARERNRTILQRCGHASNKYTVKKVIASNK